MNKSLLCIAVFMTAMTCRAAAGHGVPIDVFLDGNNKLYVPQNFVPGPFINVAGVLITTDLPGLGVLSPGNGVPDDSDLYLNVTSSLMYWNGTAIVPTSTSLVIDSPTLDGFGNVNNSPVPSYTVTGTSGLQTGMLFGTYDASPPGWDTHGNFSLVPNSANPGVYGIAISIDSPGHEATDPFLLSWEYDPSGTISQSSVDAGRAAMQQLVVPEPSTLMIASIGSSILLGFVLRRRQGSK